ncbi:DUF1801 domain-containing protein [Aquimarina gracilis]|uniref:DUF1801 domain-containing protein n=1 Tax=Aquimarina gracilis TaxID=874422 RepID=A0ABU5ZST1_9FLAO|nr:DUF1801 domain-containing protein [Aquimarina gracilis]MEB3345084.1 DUF1801 domain-containing protein [Aquimarina gracilis]
MEEDWRKEKVILIHNMILKEQGLKEYINYKMLAYGDGKQEPLLHLNAQKNYVSLYVGNIDKVEKARELLNPFDMGKGCIRIKKTLP